MAKKTSSKYEKLLHKLDIQLDRKQKRGSNLTDNMRSGSYFIILFCPYKQLPPIKQVALNACVWANDGEIITKFIKYAFH